MDASPITMQPQKQVIRWTFHIVAYWMIFDLFVRDVLAVDKGFELLFSTQKTTYYGIKVNFTTPRPTWLNGTYVSILVYFNKIC